jgi:hypothetical protein
MHISRSFDGRLTRPWEWHAGMSGVQLQRISPMMSRKKCNRSLPPRELSSPLPFIYYFRHRAAHAVAAAILYVFAEWQWVEECHHASLPEGVAELKVTDQPFLGACVKKLQKTRRESTKHEDRAQALGDCLTDTPEKPRSLSQCASQKSPGQFARRAQFDRAQVPQASVGKLSVDRPLSMAGNRRIKVRHAG